MFLAKTLTIVLAILAVITMMVAAGQRRRNIPRGSITVTHLNRELDSLRDSLQRVVLDKFAFKKYAKAEKKSEKEQSKQQKHSAEQGSTKVADETEDDADARRRRVFVLDFDGDMEASGLESLRQEITAVLTMAEPRDEVMLRLESPGGLVHAYGLASSQLLRFKQKLPEN
jgi:serine protease SohB